jgi:hypothetical protein
VRLRAASTGEWAFIDIDNNWKRIQYTGTLDSETMYASIGLRYSESSSDADFLICGAQIELGDTFTSYIPTAGAPVTREADDLRYIGGPTAELSMQIGFENDVETPNTTDFRLFGSADSRGTGYEIRAVGGDTWDIGMSPGGFVQNVSPIAFGKNVFSGVYEPLNQQAYLDGEQRNAETNGWSQPDHSNQYIQLGRWKTTVTTIPLRFSTFKLWNLVLPDDELQALSGQDYNCPGA